VAFECVTKRETSVNRFLRGLGLILWLAVCTVTHAQTTWDAQDYDLYMGDFNGDGKTDVLYVAKSANGISGINLSDGNGPNIPLESWSSNYLGINWSANQYTVIVADFNGDGKADVLLQSSTPGNSYLLFANAQGMLTGISQTIAENTAGLAWSADQHRLVAGDFNHDGLADLFFQATSSSGINAVMLASATGQFTATAPVQSWSDGFLGFKWSTTESLVYAANFDGINGDDLLIQARPVFVLINYDVPFPVPTFPPNTDGVVLAQAAAPFFQIAGVQAWNSNSFGVNWSPLFSTVVVGDFNGGGPSDVILQGKHTGQASDLLIGNASGTIFATGTALASNVSWTADNYRLLVAQFAGPGAQGVYFQALTPEGANLYASSVTGTSVSTVAQTAIIPSDIVSYVYDELGRLITVTHSGAANNNVQARFSYDNANNRTQVTVTGVSP
jgi:FG-GAP-like repeat/RHS Repeat